MFLRHAIFEYSPRRILIPHEGMEKRRPRLQPGISSPTSTSHLHTPASARAHCLLGSGPLQTEAERFWKQPRGSSVTHRELIQAQVEELA